MLVVGTWLEELMPEAPMAEREAWVQVELEVSVQVGQGQLGCMVAHLVSEGRMVAQLAATTPAVSALVASVVAVEMHADVTTLVDLAVGEVEAELDVAPATIRPECCHMLAQAETTSKKQLTGMWEQGPAISKWWQFQQIFETISACA